MKIIVDLFKIASFLSIIQFPRLILQAAFKENQTAFIQIESNVVYSGGELLFWKYFLETR